MKSDQHTQARHRPRTARELGIMTGFPPPPEKRPNLENWDLPPFNRWSFQNIRSLFPTTNVSRGAGPAIPFQHDLQPIEELLFTDCDGESRSVSEWLTESYTDGFIVCHRGKLVCELYMNDMQPGTPHLSQSVAKSVVGTLAGVLCGRGLMHPDQLLSDIVPELGRCGYAGATVSHVLDMQSGVRFSEDYNLPGSNMTRIDIASGWRPPRPGEPFQTIRDVILTLPQEAEHGQRFSYRSIETDVLAWTMERATGLTLAQLLSQEIWSKIGAEQDAFFTVDVAGTALADGGFNATLRDFARFGLMVLNDGMVGDDQVVPKTWIERSRTGDASKFHSPYTDLLPDGAYSLKWWIGDVGLGDLMARGVFGQLIYMDPKADFLAVKLSTWPDYVIERFSREAFAAVRAIRDALTI